jgi:hypothetical protein
MLKQILLQKLKAKKNEEGVNKRDLARFVSNQFRQLAQKNLRLPITLYHL